MDQETHIEEVYAAIKGGTRCIIVTGAAGSETYLFDVIGNYIDLDDVYDKIAADAAMIAPAFDATAAYAIGDVVSYENGLYKFTSAHAAGAWDANDVSAVTVKSLIDAAEPSALTNEQVTALVNLLN